MHNTLMCIVQHQNKLCVKSLSILCTSYFEHSTVLKLNNQRNKKVV